MLVEQLRLECQLVLDGAETLFEHAQLLLQRVQRQVVDGHAVRSQRTRRRRIAADQIKNQSNKQTKAHNLEENGLFKNTFWESVQSVLLFKDSVIHDIQVIVLLSMKK